MGGDSFSGCNFPSMTLAVFERESVKLKALIFCDCPGGCRIDAAAEENDRFIDHHKVRLADLGSFHGIALFVPADDSLVENFHIPVIVFVENAKGQTGQVVGAGSIEDHEPILGNAFYVSLEFAKRRGNGA